MMRMKDSEDYITSRAANPRTGLISPSVGTRTPCTPDSPGHALRLRKAVHASPSPVTVVRTPSRANQGRKISGGYTYGGSAQEPALFVHRRSLTPPVNGVESDRASQCSVPKDDQLIHMPSADEPQPFAYPGYSDEQIKAFEHYRRKARRTSSEGYDRRILRPSGKLATPPGAFDSYDDFKDDHDLWVVHPATSQQFQPYRHRKSHEKPSHLHYHNIAVRKGDHTRAVSHPHQRPQAARGHVVVSEAKTPNAGAKTTALLSAPFASPKTCAVGKLAEEEQTSSGGARQDEAYLDNNFGTQEIFSSATAQIPRKAIAWAPRHTPVAKVDRYAEDHTEEVLPSTTPCHGIERGRSGEVVVCQELPPVQLIRPSIPGAELAPRIGQRQCSFGCRTTSDGQCLVRRNMSTGTLIRHKSYMDPEPDSAPTDPPLRYAEVALGTFYSLLTFMQGLRIPKSAQMEILLSPDASLQAKAEALKGVLSILAHAVAVCTLLAVGWKLGAAVLHLFEVLLWPLVVPWRVLRWVACAAG